MDIPFILVSGIGDADLAMERIKAGVHEHVVKDNLARLPSAVKRELGSAQERRNRKHATGEQIVSRVESREDAIDATSLQSSVVGWNGSVECLLG